MIDELIYARLRLIQVQNFVAAIDSPNTGPLLPGLQGQGAAGGGLAGYKLISFMDFNFSTRLGYFELLTPDSDFRLQVTSVFSLRSSGSGMLLS